MIYLTHALLEIIDPEMANFGGDRAVEVVGQGYQIYLRRSKICHCQSSRNSKSSLWLIEVVDSKKMEEGKR